MFESAIKELKRNNLVVYPTETVYGVGANAFSKKAIKKVYEVKKRPLNKPISVAISDLSMLRKVAKINKVQLNIIKKTLPGPITYIVKKRKEVPSILTSNKQKIGIRYPDNWIALELISRYGKPITSTSANLTGKKPPRRFSEIKINVKEKLFGGGPLYKEPSTVYDLTTDKLIRRGPITTSEIKKARWR